MYTFSRVLIHGRCWIKFSNVYLCRYLGQAEAKSWECLMILV